VALQHSCNTVQITFSFPLAFFLTFLFIFTILSVQHWEPQASGAPRSASRTSLLRTQCSRTTNGLRIKTYQGGKGAVFNVKYENVTMTNVQHPIILNQV